MRDMAHDIAAVTAILPGTYSADPIPITIDRTGFDAVTFVLQLGTGGITFTDTKYIDFVMEQSDDGATWADIWPDQTFPLRIVTLGTAANDRSGLVLRQKTAHPDPTVHRFGYVDGTVGDKRYVRLRPIFTGTHATGTPMAATAILGHGRELPISIPATVP